MHEKGSSEFRKFVDVSLGSLSELAYLLRLSNDLNLISNQEWEQIEVMLTRASKLTWGLYNWSARGGRG